MDLMPGSPKLPTRRMPPIRLAVLLGVMVSLLTGLDAAVLRLGLSAPISNVSLSQSHGVLMVYGFLGTAICLERAVALQSDRSGFTAWAYASPLASVAAVVMTLAGERIVAAAAWTASMTLLVLVYWRLWQRQPSRYLLIQSLGAIMGLSGIALWGRGFEIAAIVPWWMAFLVFTIVGERLELARLEFSNPRVENRIVTEALLLTLGVVLTIISPDIGYPVTGLALATLMIDMGSHDVARRTINSHGGARFMAACMVSGYVWSLVAAGVWIVKGPVLSGYSYDTVVHSLTIGFALSMVMAHAPVIIPAVARKNLPYSPLMWVAWGLLQIGLVIRILSGARNLEVSWQFGGALNVLATLSFIVVTVLLVVLSRQETPKVAADG